MNSNSGAYDDYAADYAASNAWREAGGVEGDAYGILPCLLPLLGGISERRSAE